MKKLRVFRCHKCKKTFKAKKPAIINNKTTCSICYDKIRRGTPKGRWPLGSSWLDK